MKTTLIILFLPLTFLFGQNFSSKKTEFNPTLSFSLKQHSFVLDAPTLITNQSNHEFFNSNVRFDNFENSLRSTAKMSAEAVTGAVVGLALGLFLHNLTEPSPEREGNFFDVFFNATITGIGGIAGSNLGVISLGNLLGDDGSIKNTFYWSIIGGGIFALIANIITNNENIKFWITATGIPIGASIGFNSNNLFD